MARRKTVLFVAALVLALAACRFYNLNLDTSLSALFPDSSPEMADTGRLLQYSPGTRVMLVELRAAEDGRNADMLAIGAKLRGALGSHLHQSGSAGLPEPRDLLNLLPQLFDAEMEDELARRFTPEAISDRLAALRAQMAGPLTFIPKKYLRDDPLGLIGLVTGRLPAGLEGAGFMPSGPDFGGLAGGGGAIMAEDGRRALVVLQPELGINDVYGAKKFMDALDGALGDVLGEYPGISAIASGGLRFTAENTAAIESDLKLTVSLSIFFIALIYLFTVRSFGAIWLLLTPVAAVIFAGSAMSALWPATAGLALGFGAAVLGLAEDYAVLVHFALRRNPERRALAVGALARPMVFSAGLCISSFCVLMFSGIPALRQMGFFAAFSLFAGLLIAVFVLPCCPFMDRPRIAGSGRDDGSGGGSGPGLANLRPRLLPTLLIAAACLSVCAAGFARVPFDAGFQNLGANSRELQDELMELRSRWGASAEPDVWVSSGADLDAALAESARLKRGLAGLSPGSGAVFSLSDMLPPERERRENEKRWNGFVERNGRELAERLDSAAVRNGFKPGAFAGFAAWFRASGVTGENMNGAERAGAAPLELLKRAGMGELVWWMLVERDGEAHVLSFDFSGKSGSGAKLSGAAGLLAGGKSVLLSSTAVAQSLNDAFEREKHLLPLAGLVCLALLALCFRKFRLIALAALPPLFGLASVLVWLWLSGSALNLAGAAALTLVIGLGADYGIVMLHELASDLSLGAFKSILVSGLTTLAGLGVLILAKHPVLHALGSITFFGLLAEMAAVLLIVPFLCKQTRADPERAT